MILLDANIILRYVTGDAPAQATRCEHLLSAVARAEQPATISSLCIAEIGWVLDRIYRFPRSTIVGVLRRLLRTDSIQIPERDVWLKAVDLFETHRVDLIDAYHVAFMDQHEIRTICSYDTDFDEIPGITRREP